MSEFLEERLPVCVRMGNSYADEYTVEITQTANRGEYRRLVQQYPVRIFNIRYTRETSVLWDQILSLYHRCYGMFAGFRVKVDDDFSTNNLTGIPTALDFPLDEITATTFQLQTYYGLGGSAITIGLPSRLIYKPVSGTVKIAVAGVEQFAGWTVDYTTGIVTFDVDPSGTVTGGCEFDIPCRFNSRIDVRSMATHVRETSEIEIIELLNP